MMILDFMKKIITELYIKQLIKLKNL